MKRVYAQHMDTNRHKSDSRNRSERQIAALLQRMHESSSIVDSLMDIPLSENDSAAPEWDAAVARKLESRLSEMMRALIDSEPEQKSA